MSKQVKELICSELAGTFAGVDAVMVVDPTRLDATSANQLRRDMAAVNIRMQLVKNSLVRRALAGTALEPVGQLLDGPCALTWGGESIVDVAKLLAAKTKELASLTIKGAVMEGSALGPEAAAALSKLPSKAEMRSIVVGTIASPGRRLAASILGAGSMIANLLKGRIESLEKSEGGEAPAAA